jgi:hypothetical protein
MTGGVKTSLQFVRGEMTPVAEEEETADFQFEEDGEE